MTEPGAARGGAAADAPAAAAGGQPEPMPTGTDVSGLIAIIDRLEELLERSALSELEVEAGGTTLLLRKPLASPRVVSEPVITSPEPGTGAADVVVTRAEPDGVPHRPPGRHAVTAPLTGVFYLAPSPDAAPYVREGGEVNVGQVIGLVEAMKLFNEIKSDVAGIVRRIAAESGALVKAKQTLIEVEPW
jgi:acetyl-CoA carboxylase biotin carboxyl carrier protein